MEIAAILADVTVTWQEAFTPLPSFAAARTVAVPGLTAVTLPLVLTVATEESVLDQATLVSAAFQGLNAVTLICAIPPVSSVTAVLLS